MAWTIGVHRETVRHIARGKNEKDLCVEKKNASEISVVVVVVTAMKLQHKEEKEKVDPHRHLLQPQAQAQRQQPIPATCRQTVNRKMGNAREVNATVKETLGSDHAQEIQMVHQEWLLWDQITPTKGLNLTGTRELAKAATVAVIATTVG